MRTLKEFYKYYEEIPDEQWTEGEFHSDDGERHCALGFLRRDQLFQEEYKLDDIFKRNGFDCVPHVNDGNHGHHRLGNTPKERILKAISIIIEKLSLKRKKKAPAVTGERIPLPSLKKAEYV